MSFITPSQTPASVGPTSLDLDTLKEHIDKLQSKVKCEIVLPSISTIRRTCSI